MSSSAQQTVQDISAVSVKQEQQKEEIKPSRDGLYISGVVLISVAAWYIGQFELYKPGSEIGYNLGLVGGIMMLVLLLYPVRKRFRFMRSWMPIKHWFRAHMFLGVAGPILVLFHSNVHFTSITGGVALICMIAVFASGLIGRVIYTRIHRGLYGRRLEFDDIKARMGMNEEEVHSKFHFAPRIEKRLLRFEQRALADGAARTGHLWFLPILSLWSFWTYRRSTRDLKRLLKVAGKEKGWSRSKKRRRLRYGKSVIWHFTGSVKKVASFHAYERMFSLWHILHVPLLFLLIVAGAIHVLAVHMY
jgi:hypothetical protein